MKQLLNTIYDEINVMNKSYKLLGLTFDEDDILLLKHKNKKVLNRHTAKLYKRNQQSKSHKLQSNKTTTNNNTWFFKT